MPSMIARASVVALCVLAVSAWEASPQNQPDPKASKTGGAAQQQTTQPPAPVVQNQQATPKPQQDPSNGATSNNPDISQKALVWSAIVQAAAAVIVMVFTGALLIYSHRGWQVAKVAADAAKDSADAVLLAERAWVAPHTFIFHVSTEEPRRITIGVQVKNTGGTPAVNFAAQLRGHVTPIDISKDIATLDRRDIPMAAPSSAVLFPGVEVSMGAMTATALADEIDGIQSGRLRLFITGHMNYRDVFGKSHTTTFAVVYVPHGNRFDYCETYNTAT